MIYTVTEEKGTHAFLASCVTAPHRHSNAPQPQQISATIKESIVSYIRRRLAPKPIKIRADIEVTCFAFEGIEAIKSALQAGLDTPTNSEVEIKLIAPPM